MTDRPIDLVESGFDLASRFGALPDKRLNARNAMSTRRFLCASPGYLKRQGILIRSEWDLAKYLDSGRLKIVLPEFDLPVADLFVHYPSKRNQTIRACVH